LQKLSKNQLIVDQKPDLVFLEIAMSHQSGFDMLERFPDLNFEIIFVSSFDKYAVDAFKFNAAGYIVKPIDNDDLLDAVKVAKKRITSKKESESNKELLQILKNPISLKKRIGIPSSDGFSFVQVENIIRCEGMQRCTKVFLRNEKTIVSSCNLGEFIKLLLPYNFFSPHRSHLVNLSHVTEYKRDGKVTMTDGSTVPVSRRKRQEFLHHMTHL